MNVLDVSYLPQYPRSDGKRPEELYEDGWYPNATSDHLRASSRHDVPLETLTTCVVGRWLSEKAKCGMESAGTEEENEGGHKLYMLAQSPRRSRLLLTERTRATSVPT